MGWCGGLSVVLLAVVVLICCQLPCPVSSGISAGRPVTPQTQTPPEVWQSLLKVRNAKNRGEIPEMTPSHAKSVFLRAPRNYSLVFFVTTSDSQCQACHMVERPLLKVMSILRKDRVGDESVFLYRIDISKEHNRDMLQQLQVQQLPAVVHVGPSRESISTSPDDHFRLSHSTLSAPYIVNWINSRARSNIYIPQPIWLMFVQLLAGTSTIVALVTVLILIFGVMIVFHFQDPKNSPLRNPLTWFFVTLICFFLNQAGVVWDIIRNPPAIGIDHNSDEPQLIAHGNNQQYVFEGILIGAINTVIAVSFIGITVFTPKIKNQWIQRGFFLVLFAIILVFFYVLSKIYCIKHPYYPFCLRF